MRCDAMRGERSHARTESRAHDPITQGARWGSHLRSPVLASITDHFSCCYWPLCRNDPLSHANCVTFSPLPPSDRVDITSRPNRLEYSSCSSMLSTFYRDRISLRVEFMDRKVRNRMRAMRCDAARSLSRMHRASSRRATAQRASWASRAHAPAAAWSHRCALW